MVDPRLLEMIGCPFCDEHPPLRMEEDSFVCDSCRRIYPVVDGIPILIPDRSIIKE